MKITQQQLVRVFRTYGGSGSGNFDHAGRPGEVGGSASGGGGKVYSRADHERFHKQVLQRKAELKRDRSLSPSSRESALSRWVFPLYDPITKQAQGQSEVASLKSLAESLQKKDVVAAEMLSNAYEMLVDREGKFDPYGNIGAAHDYLNQASREVRGVLDAISPPFLVWIKMHPSSSGGDISEEGEE